ncbi:MAG: RNA polymerase sigma factor [Gammaproteobacteria bacterium]|nr:MAG: RNA polymerase sigma factor [Gammaproteobacteria bacterium]
MDQDYYQNINLTKNEAISLSIDQATTTAKTAAISMDVFLQDIEKKAYHMAYFAVSNHADALDLLQDAMIKLVTKYQHRPANEWKPLFYKILKNRIRDWHRHQKIRNLVLFWKPQQQQEGVEQWPAVVDISTEHANPEHELAKAKQQAAALEHLQQLSEKQQQCFLLRSWEGLSVADTADVMGCSQGSVKTHYFRAVHKLKKLLEEDHEITF